MLDKNTTVELPIQWYEGMLVGPQHFQQFTKFLLNQQFIMQGAAHPYFWGVLAWACDPVRLVAGKLIITQLDVILPDGGIVSLDVERNDPLPELDLTPFKEQIQKKPITVFLAVPRHLKDVAASGGDFPRYDCLEGAEEFDENTGEGRVTVPRLRPKIVLLAQDELPVRYTGFPLCQISFQADAFGLVKYTPASAWLRPEAALFQTLTTLLETVRLKLAFLADRLQATITPATLPLIQGYQKNFAALVPPVLKFETLLQTQKANPFALYLALCDMVGHFCHVRSGQLPPVLPPYVHDALDASFAPLVRFLQEMLDLVRESCLPIEFKQHERVFGLTLDEKWLGTDLIVGVQAGAEMAPADLVWWVSNCVIASNSFVQKVRDNRVLGAPRTIVSEAEELGLVPGQNMVLLKIPTDQGYLQAGEVLSIFNNADTDARRPITIFLYVPKG